ncbi:MAG: Zn-ribbon domain-containing OB-fold protein [Hyphomicrobiales bacterium]|nr:Zn-ribbon domain-containing OB-fold protein [Hyphomicrobiales bacterium]
MPDTSDPSFSGPGPDQQFADYLAQGKFMIQRSASTGAYVFYPRAIAPGTGAADLEWVEASGEGTVYTTTVVRQRPEKGGDYNVAVIELKEGPRLMSRVEGIAPEDVSIGMAVRARIGAIKDQPALLFEPA